MKQGFVMFLAVLFLSIEIALAQTQATGTVAAAEDGSPVIGALTQLLPFELFSKKFCLNISELGLEIV